VNTGTASTCFVMNSLHIEHANQRTVTVTAMEAKELGFVKALCGAAL
jgi:hypothetical protein